MVSIDFLIRSETHEQRDVARRAARSSRSAQQDAARPRARARTRHGAGRPAGQGGAAGGELREQFAMLARGAGNLGRRGVAQQHDRHFRRPQDRNETHEKRNVARRTAM